VADSQRGRCGARWERPARSAWWRPNHLAGRIRNGQSASVLLWAGAEDRKPLRRWSGV